MTYILRAQYVEDLMAMYAIEGSRSSRAQVSRPQKQEGGEA